MMAATGRSLNPDQDLLGSDATDRTLSSQYQVTRGGGGMMEMASEARKLRSRFASRPAGGSSKSGGGSQQRMAGSDAFYGMLSANERFRYE
jgi:hypothetical protein